LKEEESAETAEVVKGVAVETVEEIVAKVAAEVVTVVVEVLHQEMVIKAAATEAAVHVGNNIFENSNKIL